MPRRMSCFLTKDQVRDGTKTVTRREVGTWQTLKAGDLLTFVEKAQGLKKGEKQVVIRDGLVTDVGVERLHMIDEDECYREGFPDLTPGEFMRMWLDSHGYGRLVTQNDVFAVDCRRIGFIYVAEDDLFEQDAERLVDMRTDVIDFPTAWAIQRRIPLLHMDACSSVPGGHPLAGPAFLCDCGAVSDAWKRRVNA